MSSKNWVRGIEGVGEVVTVFDTVGFRVTVKTVDTTGPAAKAKARPVIDKLSAAIATLRNDHDVTMEEGSEKISFSVKPNTVRREYGYVSEGYVAEYVVSFRTPNINKTDIIMDTLTSVEGVQVDAPEYRLNDPDAHYEDAFGKAVRNAKLRFQKECRALELDPLDFTIEAWTVQGNHDPVAAGKFASLGGGGSGDDSPIELQEGDARVRVTVQLQYVRTPVDIDE